MPEQSSSKLGRWSRLRQQGDDREAYASWRSRIGDAWCRGEGVDVWSATDDDGNEVSRFAYTLTVGADDLQGTPEGDWVPCSEIGFQARGSGFLLLDLRWIRNETHITKDIHHALPLLQYPMSRHTEQLSAYPTDPPISNDLY